MTKYSKTYRFLAGELMRKYPWAQAERVMEYVPKLYETICSENASDSPAVRKHTFSKIYPAMVFYRAIQLIGIPQEEALAFVDSALSHQAESTAQSLRKLLPVAGLYKKYPAMYGSIARKSFGEKVGFRQKFYDVGKNRCKFDMTRCLYYETCKRYNCPELTVCFCHTDDVNAQDVHPRILWNRTQTIGEGAPFCDFDIIALQDGETAEDYQKAPDGKK